MNEPIGYANLLNQIKREGLVPFDYPFKVESESFKLYRDTDDKYVTPTFSRKTTSVDDCEIEDAEVILISAIGATGKTMLTKRLSYDLKCPVVDLGKSEVVASYSLTGLLFNNLDYADGASYMKDLETGNAVIIIDALDEGYQKTNYDGYLDYLNEIKNRLRNDDGTFKNNSSSKSKVTFILLGRTNAVDYAVLHLESLGIKVVSLQIEPFTIAKAQEFIDKHVNSEYVNKFKDNYIKARDYILHSIHGFLNDEHSIKNKTYERFIGYAPVLMAISTFFDNEGTNFYQVLVDLKANNKKGIDLIIDVIEKILIREKEEKVDVNLLPNILKKRSTEFQRLVYDNIYTIDEQCSRILYKLLKRPYPFEFIEDEFFNVDYSEKIEEWVDEHPFLMDGSLANVVFESYILAKLVKNNLYKDAVYDYMASYYKDSYLFFYMYDKLYPKEGEQSPNVDIKLLPYLYSSLKALDSDVQYYTLECDRDEYEDKMIVSFEGSDLDNMPSYEYNVVANEEPLILGTYVADYNINVPNDIVLSTSKIELSAPSYIKCKSLIIKSKDIIINTRGSNDKFIIESDTISCDISDGSYPTFADINKKNFILITTQDLSYPLIDFQSQKYKKEKEWTPMIVDLYQKLRRTIIMFRSHSKGQLAKYQEKIDNRIGSTPMGKAVLDALIQSGILVKEQHLYVINTERMDQELGVNYNGIRESVRNNEILAFLQKIEVKHL